MDIQFLGAAGTVTGSKFLISKGQAQLLVDCGLFQGLKELRLKNWETPGIDLDKLDAVVLTHAHIDHSGYVPLLVKCGYRGPIYCSAPTAELCAILWPDSARIQEEDADYANRKGFSKHHPALPLYTVRDAEVAINQIRVIDIGKVLKVGELSCELFPAGHILGATSVKVRSATQSVLISGDVGRFNDLVEHQPAAFGETNFLIMESTYGDRLHPAEHPVQALADEVRQAVAQNGVLLIPSFAVGRAQMLLYCLSQAFKKKLCPQVPVYVNSPMATRVTSLYRTHTNWHRLTDQDCQDIDGMARFVSSVEESIALNNKPGPMVIISASGMLTGGRILHHLKEFGRDRRNTILLAGYQAPGTRGHTLAMGQRTLKLHGQYIDIHAEVRQLDIFSAHADQEELLTWLRRSGGMPKRIYLVHGEPGALAALAGRIREELGIAVEIPRHGETVSL